MTADPPPKQRCLALTRRGTPCRNWAMRAGHQRAGRPLCRAHRADPDSPAAAVVPWHLYTSYFTPAERAALRQLLDTLAAGDPGADPLAAEIETARITLRRLLAHTAALGTLTTDQLLRLTPLILTTTRTIARLLKDQQALHRNQPDPMEAILHGAVDILSEKWGVEL